LLRYYVTADVDRVSDRVTDRVTDRENDKAGDKVRKAIGTGIVPHSREKLLEIIGLKPDSVINEIVYQLYGLTQEEIRIVEGK